MMKTCFPDAKQIIQCPKTLYANNVHMLKKVEMKGRGVLTPHLILNITFHHHIFMKDL